MFNPPRERPMAWGTPLSESTTAVGMNLDRRAVQAQNFEVDELFLL